MPEDLSGDLSRLINELSCTREQLVQTEGRNNGATTALSPEDVAVTAAGELVIALPKQHSIIRVGLDGRLFSIVPPTIARPVPLSLCICPLTGDCIFIDQSVQSIIRLSAVRAALS